MTKTAIKTEFICVNPLSKEAEDRFVNKMDKLHSCRVEKREYGKVYLSSISGRYMCSMFEGSDDHWEVI